MNKFTPIFAVVQSFALVACCAHYPCRWTAGRVPDGKVGAIYYPTGSRHGAAVAIEKFVPDEVAVGALFEYQIKVSNVSSSVLEDVLVKETFDESFAFKESTPIGSAAAGRVMVFGLGSIQPGQSHTITISGTAAKPGSITSCATLDYRIPCCASIRVSAPGLHLETTMMSDAILCDTITGKFAVSNPGSSMAHNVVIKDVLAEGLTTSEGNKTIDIAVGDLQANEARTYAFALKAERTGKFAHTATATADGDMTTASTPVSVTVRQPILAVNVECPAGPIVIGGTGTFTFLVENTGDAPAASAVLHVDISSSMKFKSADNGGTVAGAKLTFDLGTLAQSEKRTLSAVYFQNTTGVISARARVLAACATEQHGWCETKVQGTADIGLLLTDAPGVTTVGDDQVYRCDVENRGRIDLTNVVVAASWPKELEWVRSDVAVAASAGNKSEFQFGTIKVGEVRKFTFTLKAKSAGEFKIALDATAKEITNALHREEITTFIDR